MLTLNDPLWRRFAYRGQVVSGLTLDASRCATAGPAIEFIGKAALAAQEEGLSSCPPAPLRRFR